MKEQASNLEALLARAREAQPLMSLPEVEAMLADAPVVPTSSKPDTAFYIMITSLISIIVLSIFINLDTGPEKPVEAFPRLYLNTQQLSQLGITIGPDSIRYAARVPYLGTAEFISRTHAHASGRVWLKSHDIEEAAEWPETDFHLQSVTQLDGNVIFSRNDRQPVYFYAAYVPVRLEKPDSDGDSLNFWFSPREALWELLPTEQATRYRAYAAQLLDQEGIDPFVHQPFEAVDAIQLDDEALERLGFRFSENSLHYTRVISAEQYIRLDLTGGTDCIAIQDLEQPTDDWDNTYVRFVSDLQGFQGLRWTLPGESPSKNSPSYLDRVQAQLVPVLIECDFLPKSYLFWFEADEQFLATIYGQEDAPFGERYATWLKTQHPGLVEGTNPIRLAPNPASGYTELRLEGVGEEPYRWQLINLQGQVIRTSDWQAFGEAARINLNGLPTGIYLVVVRLESGAQFRSQLLLEQ